MGANASVLASATGIAAAFAWLKLVKTGPVYQSKADLRGKTVVITGANIGIGKETAVNLAKRGARVIIACRNEKKSVQAVADIKKRSESNSVHFMMVDLSESDSVRRFAAEVLASESRLDVLVNNAATFIGGKNCDGIDLMLATNQLGPFLLTNLLMPLLKKTAQLSPVRIVNVCSEAYKVGKLDFDNMNPDIDAGADSRKIFTQYSSTKLMNILFTTELDRRLKLEDPQSHSVTTFAVHPGMISSHLGSDLAEKNGRLSVLLRSTFMALFTRSPLYGCQTTLYCCLEEGLESQSGRYFSNLKVNKLLPHACDADIGRKLWEVCEKMVILPQ